MKTVGYIPEDDEKTVAVDPKDKADKDNKTKPENGTGKPKK